ncbi:molybdopterin-dependent oxidoreductase [Streptomyces wuyuanensis]|uniref:DMSO/TMAO reductase YedYZ, molybdopterin-dependent catalytic subunit n=1 Tax=Streptomyces wuyuanensis TaxID=1196353 RepID=A0A1G9WRM5_9ACTN|nr:DMSO/TMAO reductase YedYZ, molybdopterin-dependent catalytic subunit [Streptomyces wuyuanensis]
MNETTQPPGPAPSDPPPPDPGTPSGPGASGDPARPPSSDPDSEGTPVGRRTVLAVLGLGAAGVAAAPWLQRGLEAFLGSVADKDPTKLTGLLPNGGGFRYYSVAASVPRRTPADYRLTVDGLVERPTEFTLGALRRLPQTRLVRDVQCVTGWRVPDTPFEGVRLADLLDAVGVRPEARAVRFTCFDGVYSESLTLDQARRSDVLVCLRMRDEPLSHAHGGPVRLYVAPMYFYKSAKWLSGISLTRDVRPGYWEERGYDIDAWVGRSNGRDDAPTV